MDIAELNLSVRDFNAVKRFGINSTEELIERLPDFCKEHRRTGAKVTETLHKLGLLPFHLGEWVEPERCAEELAPEEFREGAFIIMGFPTESRDWRKVVMITKIDGDQLYFIDGKSDLMHHTIGDRKVWHIKLESEEAGMSEEMKPTVIVSEDYTRAVTLTRSIIANAQAAQQSLYEVCKGLKEMRDGKLYRELGYQNFADFCENETGIKISQAKKYVAIADRLTDETATRVAEIGVQKLYMLAMLDEPTREAVTETVDVENTTVKELKAKVKELKQNKSVLIDDIKRIAADRDEAKAAADKKDKQFRQAMESKNHEIIEVKTGWKRRSDMLMTKIKMLQDELKAAKTEPQEVAVEDTSRVEELEQQLAKAQSELADATAKLNERPMVQTALPGDGGERRRGEYAAITNAVSNALEDLMDFLEDNDQCRDFRYFATKAKEKLRAYNSKLNDMLAKEESSCQ